MDNPEFLAYSLGLIGFFLGARYYHSQQPKLLKGAALQQKFPLRAVIIGPPASGKSTISRMLSERANLVEVHTDKIFEDAQEDSKNVIGQKLKTFFEQRKDNERPPASLFMPLVVEHFNKLYKEQPNKGWLLERGCRETNDFNVYQESGIFPQKVIVLDLDLDTILKRTTTRWYDPLTEQNYNKQGSWPTDPEIVGRLKRRPDDESTENVKKRVERYHLRSKPVIELYPKEIVRHFDASETPEKIFQKIKSFLEE